MTQSTPERNSLCKTCGKRLSEKSASGAIHWKPSHIDDKGIHCETCGSKLDVTKNKKGKSA